MGVGNPLQILESIEQGIDMFDSRLPTMSARGATLFTCTGNINIRNGKYRQDNSRIDEWCDCEVCKKFSRAYICHLMRSHEPTGAIYCTIHNLRFLHKLIEEAKDAIKKEEFKKYVEEFREETTKILQE